MTTKRKAPVEDRGFPTIEQLVNELTPAELAEFRRWFAVFDAAAWDR